MRPMAPKSWKSMSTDLLESLLAPLSADAPCGADPEYDPDFLALQEASARRSEQQFGNTVVPAQEPDWVQVFQRASALVGRTRDLRIAVLFARSGARIEGLAGAARGLQLLRGLLERYWTEVHPCLDASEDGDPTARLNALAPLSHPEAGLADFRAASLTGKRGGVTLRDIELAIGHAEPLPGEAMPTEDGVLQGVQSAIAARPEVAQQMLDVRDAAIALGTCFEQHLDATRTPELEALQKLLGQVADTARRVAGMVADAAGPVDGESAPGSAPTSVATGALRSREDVIRVLDRACDWIERNEPTNPAPLLIRRSQRLMTKNFLDIIRDLVPDGVAQIEKLAGPVDP